ncbi:MAG: enoyl-CoA hydratase, partial [Pseudomonadota bacterium]
MAALPSHCEASMSTENEQVVLTERRGHILVVTLNRPEVHN